MMVMQRQEQVKRGMACVLESGRCVISLIDYYSYYYYYIFFPRLKGRACPDSPKAITQ